MSVLERRPSCTESNEGNKERQGPFLGVRFTEMSESIVQSFFFFFFFCSIFVKTLDETTHIQFHNFGLQFIAEIVFETYQDLLAYICCGS